MIHLTLLSEQLKHAASEWEWELGKHIAGRNASPETFWEEAITPDQDERFVEKLKLLNNFC